MNLLTISFDELVVAADTCLVVEQHILGRNFVSIRMVEVVDSHIVVKEHHSCYRLVRSSLGLLCIKLIELEHQQVLIIE